jgi:hypothetical protein
VETKMKERSGQDFAAGMLFALIGAVALYISADYSMGTSHQPGTGVLPRILAWGLVAIGAAQIVQGMIVEFAVLRRAAPTVAISAVASAILFFGGPAIGIEEGWSALPIVIGFLALMESLLPGTAWRPLFAVTLATVAFGLTIDELGLVVAMVVSLTLCAFGTHETRWREFSMFLVVMLIIGVGGFIWLLGMPVPIWPVKVPGWLSFLQR